MKQVSNQEVACPICAARVPMSSHFKNGAGRIRKCSACSVGFVYPRLSGPKLLSQYSPSYFQEKYDSLQQSEYLNMQSWQNKIEMCLGWVDRLRGAKTGLLLDVGCGKGWFLEAARERGWQVQGVELCPEVAKRTMERVGTQVHIGSIFDVELPPETFDLVTMFDVIEHLEEPIEALRICYRILKPGGALALSTPNLRGLGCRLLGAKAFAVWPDEHIIYFGPASMKRALQLADFTDIEIASREIYPENAATIISLLLGKNGGHTGVLNAADPGVRSVKKLFRHNRILKGLRKALNGFFGVVPLGDELLAFALKQ
jgi:2-polyprenyl-3-methyl-5-hydroxy-6-metoxy-1,4-benzoquinol methylase